MAIQTDLSRLRTALTEAPNDWDLRLITADCYEENEEIIKANAQRWIAIARKNPIEGEVVLLGLNWGGGYLTNKSYHWYLKGEKGEISIKGGNYNLPIPLPISCCLPQELWEALDRLTSEKVNDQEFVRSKNVRTKKYRAFATPAKAYHALEIALEDYQLLGNDLRLLPPMSI